MWVTDSRMLCSLPNPRSCLVHPVDRFDSEGWFTSDQVIFLTTFCVFFGKKSMQHLSEKTQFLGFRFPHVVQKHYLGEMGVCFDCLLCRQHLCEKLLQSNLYVKIMASRTWDVLSKHSV